MASGRRDLLFGQGLNDLLLERLDFANAVHDAPAQLHVDGAFSSPPPPFKGAVRDGPAVSEFLLRQAIPFHVFLHLSNSVWLRPNEGVKGNARQVSWLRDSARSGELVDGLVVGRSERLPEADPNGVSERKRFMIAL